MISKTIKSFGYAVHGLKVTWKEEINFRIESFATVAVLGLAFYFRFSSLEMLVCIIAITMVLSAEIINTAIEDLCNKVEPYTDPQIAKVKDASSAFVLVTSLGAFIAGAIVFIHHFS